MTIRFMFNFPNDTSLLYGCTDEIGESPFGGEDAITVEIRRSKEYSEAILADVRSCLSGFTEYKYLGCRERIAREVYQLTIPKASPEELRNSLIRFGSQFDNIQIK